MKKKKYYYHIHVYKIVGKAEINVIAEDEYEAKDIALRFKNNVKYKKSDCNYMAIDVL